jgi:hypothetical protein
MNVQVKGHVLVRDETNDKVLLDKDNAIHPQNMARILARGLANEDNSTIFRMAFGNGGTFVDAGSNIVFNPPNDGSISGWESRLYNEIYSEIVDETDPDFGIDPGSSGPNVIRPGGGSSPGNDPGGGGVVSQEVGLKSNTIVTVFLNESEPSGQDSSILDPSDNTFIFDEIGLYSPGKNAVPTAGVTSINVGDKDSEDQSPLTPSSNLVIGLTVDGSTYGATISIPASGTGALGQITYGDLCEGINTGSWITSGDPINDFIYLYITDRSGGSYPSITGRQSFGLLTFQSKTVGSDSSVSVDCDSGNLTDFGNVLSEGICANVNVSQVDGDIAGSQNDISNTTNERERLLSHIIFAPIPKAQDVALSITYTLTISVCTTSDAIVDVIN